MRNLLLLVVLAAALPARAGFVESYTSVPLTRYEAGLKSPERAAMADRKIYWNDDPVGQFVFSFIGQEISDQPVKLELRRGDAVVLSEDAAITTPKLALLLRVGELPIGDYTFTATLGETAATAAFTRADHAKEVIPFPADGIAIEVQPQAFADSWPTVMGVPFPQGTVVDVSTLSLTEDGQPVSAQIDAVSHWHPRSFDGGSDYKPSVRWAHVKFIARCDEGKPRAYRLVQRASTFSQKVNVTETDDTITVDTGAMRFAVNRKTFAGIDAAWIGDKQVVRAKPEAAYGPYVQDHRGIIFASRHDAEATVTVEEAGPLRAVIAAEGWFIHPKATDHHRRGVCKFRTRLIAWAGRQDVQVQHHVILTIDTDKTRLMDIGFKLPIAGGVKQWRMGVDGKPIGGDLSGSQETFLHQYRWNKLRLFGAEGGVVEGEKADGYLSVAGETSGGGAATVCLRDVWQKFPKEMEVEPDGVVIHLWPEHGLRTFDTEEQFGRDDIYKLRYFHHGRLLDLRFPAEGYDALQELRAATRDEVDPEGMRNAAIAGNAQGLAIGADLLIRFDDAMPENAKAIADLHQLNPLARSDPQWNVATGVEGRMHARDEARFPEVERAIDTLYPQYMKAVIDGTAEYGMFIYCNWHNNWRPDVRTPRIHRVWQNSHYQQVGIPWLLYMRGASFDLLPWARANGDNYRDVSTIHYADDGDGPKRLYIPGHGIGNMYHAKGFMPWGTPGPDAKEGTTNTWAMYHAGVQAHFINPDAYLLRYLMEGDGRSWDVYQQWAKQWTGGRVWGGASREINNTLGEAMNLYANFHHPDALKGITIQAEGMLERPLLEQYANYDHPVWHRAWYTRLLEQTRDPRIGPTVVEWCGTFGNRHWMPNVFAYQVTGDKAHLETNAAAAYDLIHTIYQNPSDPVDGFRDGWSAYGPWRYRTLPYYMQAWVDAGFDRMPIGPSRFMYPSRATHPQFIDAEGSALRFVALDEGDKPFALHLEVQRRMYNPAYRFTSPSGKVLAEVKMGQPGSVPTGPEGAIHVDVPADGETGVYMVDFRNWEGIFFEPPYTNLPFEASVMEPGRLWRVGNRVEGYMAAVNAGAPFEMTFKALRYIDIASPGYVRLYDAAGTTLLDDTLLFGSQRPQRSVTIDPAKNPGPYRVMMNMYYGPDFGVEAEDGPTLVFAKTPEAAQRLAEAMGK